MQLAPIDEDDAYCGQVTTMGDCRWMPEYGKNRYIITSKTKTWLHRSNIQIFLALTGKA